MKTILIYLILVLDIILLIKYLFLIQENISQSMDNLVKLDTIQLKLEELQQQAKQFILNISVRELKKCGRKISKLITLGIIITIIVVESNAK